MPPESRSLSLPSDWLRRARSDLALAKAPLPTDVLYADLCFHAQQAAEKAIKAVYRARRCGFRYTHDISELLDGLALQGVLVPQEIREAATLTDFAAISRARLNWSPRTSIVAV